MQQLQGLENVFKFVSPHMELKSDKWKDLNITTWTREDCIEDSLQTDGYTSSLNAIEHSFYFAIWFTVQVICSIQVTIVENAQALVYKALFVRDKPVSLNAIALVYKTMLAKLCDTQVRIVENAPYLHKDKYLHTCDCHNIEVSKTFQHV